MTKNSKYNGIIPAFYACYNDQGEICTDRTKAHAQWLIAKGIQGLYLCGSSGECIYQSVAERKRTLEAVMSVAKGKITVIAHVAANNTADSAELARHAEEQGVDAIAAIPPIYFKLPEHAIVDYWNAMSAAAPNTDFMIYNIPQLAGVALTKGLLEVMLENPKVVAVKNSSMPTQDIEMWKSTGGKDLVVFNGPDEQFIAGRAMGADGGIGGTYAVMPELFLEMNACVEKWELDKARVIQYAANQIIYKCCSGRANMYAVMKGILKLQGTDIGSVRAPLTPLSDQDVPNVKEAYEMIEQAKKTYIK